MGWFTTLLGLAAGFLFKQWREERTARIDLERLVEQLEDKIDRMKQIIHIEAKGAGMSVDGDLNTGGGDAVFGDKNKE